MTALKLVVLAGLFAARPLGGMTPDTAYFEKLETKSVAPPPERLLVYQLNQPWNSIKS
jgi:hypothetical protein